MKHADHVALLAGGVTQGEGGTWADLGAGTGAFTLALADLIGPHGVIHAIDRDRASLAELRSAFVSALPQAELRIRSADFTRRLDLSQLDGVVMANALDFALTMTCRTAEKMDRFLRVKECGLPDEATSEEGRSHTGPSLHRPP